MNALIVIGVQNDFCDDGAVGISNSIHIIPTINRVREYFKTVIFVLDWHPKDHVSFYHKGGDRPPHCINDSKGAELNSGLVVKDRDRIIHKGTLVLYDSDSAFYDANTIQKQTSLNTILKNWRIDDLYLCGTQFDEAVFSTAIDALKFHYNVYIVEDAVVGAIPTRVKDAHSYLESIGVKFITSRQIESMYDINSNSDEPTKSLVELNNYDYF
jgi:nicotinamidase/pyrazinamidase